METKIENFLITLRSNNLTMKRITKMNNETTLEQNKILYLRSTILPEKIHDIFKKYVENLKKSDAVNKLLTENVLLPLTKCLQLLKLHEKNHFN